MNEIAQNPVLELRDVNLVQRLSTDMTLPQHILGLGHADSARTHHDAYPIRTVLLKRGSDLCSNVLEGGQRQLVAATVVTCKCLWNRGKWICYDSEESLLAGYEIVADRQV